jgi:multiple antibiotic resistance protein
MEQQLQAIVTILSLVNPLICAAMFTEIEAGQPRSIRMADATKAAVAVLIILAAAALAGAKILEIFGVSLDAFAIAGGGVLTLIGFSMLRGNSAHNEPAATDRADLKRSITPVILFAASPGTITGVITLAVAHSRSLLPVTALVAVAVATFVMWFVMAFVPAGKAHQESSLLRDTVTRFMGLIVVAMGVQFALTAIRHFFSVAA